MPEVQQKVKHEIEVKTPPMPLGARIYQGWVGALSKLKSSPLEIRAPRGAAARKRDWSHGRGSVYTQIPPITDSSIQEIGFYSVVEPFSYQRATYNSTTTANIL